MFLFSITFSHFLSIINSYPLLMLLEEMFALSLSLHTQLAVLPFICLCFASDFDISSYPYQRHHHQHNIISSTILCRVVVLLLLLLLLLSLSNCHLKYNKNKEEGKKYVLHTLESVPPREMSKFMVACFWFLFFYFFDILFYYL